MQREIIKKTFTLRGVEHEVFFREMSVSQTQRLLRGQKMLLDADGKAKTEVDYGVEYDRSLLQVQLTLVDESGKQVYENQQQMQNLPQPYVAQLIKAAKEAEKHFARVDEGN